MNLVRNLDCHLLMQKKKTFERNLGSDDERLTNMIKVINSNPPVLRDSDTPTVQHRWFQAFGISFPTDQRSTKPPSRSIKLSLVIRIQMAQATTNRINNPGRVRATGVSTGTETNTRRLTTSVDGAKNRRIGRL
jgi:hypothetical protein